MQRMSHRIVAVLTAVCGWAGLASAQYATPNAYPAIPIAPVQYQSNQPAAQPQVAQAQSPLARYQPAQATIVPQQSAVPQQTLHAGPPPYPGCYNCSSNATSGMTYTQNPQRIAQGAGLAPVPYNEYGTQCANGCGSLKSDLGFVFGSCKNFFNPCGPKPLGSCGSCGNGGCGGGGCSKCPAFPLGKPYGKPYSGCVYDSYANH